jgi:pimeloyl-ACP methyl ester carboxylesterase
MPQPNVTGTTSTPRYVTASDGQRLAVRTAGNPDGPTLLLVHGYPDNSSVWDAFAAAFTADHHVVAYDVRGAGRSTAPDDRSGYLMARLADDVVTVADAVSPDRPVHLVGHDWGAIQSWHAVTEPGYAHRFASCTAVSGPDLDHAGHWFRTRPDGVRATLRQAARSGYIGFFHLPVVPEAVWLTGIGGLAVSALERIGGGPHSPARRGVRDHLNGLVLMLSRSLRGELAGKGVGVTAVCPGPVDTGIVAGARLSGMGDASAARDRIGRLYRPRGYSPRRAARRVADALHRDPEVVTVTAEARAGLLLSRLGPGALRAAARGGPPV